MKIAVVRDWGKEGGRLMLKAVNKWLSGRPAITSPLSTITRPGVERWREKGRTIPFFA